MKKILPLLFLLANTAFAQIGSLYLKVQLVDEEGSALAHVPMHLYYYGLNEEIVVPAGDNGIVECVAIPDREVAIYLPYSDVKYDFVTPNVNGATLPLNLQFSNIDSTKLHPVAMKGHVVFTVKSALKGCMQTELTIRSENFSTTIYTNENGVGEALIPQGSTYSIDFPNAKEYSTITIPNLPFYAVDKLIQYEGDGKHPSNDSALLNITYLNFENQPNIGELLIATSKTTGESFQAVSNSNGLAQIKVPICGNYALSTKWFKSFASADVPCEKRKHAMNLTYRNIDSKQYEAQRKQLENLAKAREKAWEDRKKEEDSFYELMKQAWLEEEENRVFDSLALVEEQNRLDSISRADSLYLAELYEEAKRIEKEKKRNDSLGEIAKKQKADSLAKAINEAKVRREAEEERLTKESEARKKAIAEKEEEKKLAYADKKALFDAEYATKRDYWAESSDAFTVLKRKKWTNVCLVIDVTGSMNPYASSLKDWLVLRYAKHRTPQVVLYNDGDETPNANKVIGKTGGLYRCDSCRIGALAATFDVAKEYSGGDIPENDLEALLYAQYIADSATQIVLVADNNSSMRDFELLAKLNRPVRVILCGVEHDLINEEYLNLASYTKGSVHTIKNDYENLFDYKDGQELHIGTRVYRVVGKQFVRIK